MGKEITLKVAVERYDLVQALKDGRVTVPGVSFEFVDISPVHKAFKPMLERLEFDISEMALTTFLVAKSFGKEIAGLPVVLGRQFHHSSIVFNKESGIRIPKDLEGKKVGQRSYAQTTPVWVRGILQHEYGVDLNKITWVTYEGSHVAEYQDPSICERAAEGKSIDAMLQSGELAAAIGAKPGPNIEQLIPNAKDAGTAWYAKTGIYPINHMVVVKSALAKEHPELMLEIFNAFKKAKQIHLDKLASLDTESAEYKAGDIKDPSKPWILPYGEQRRLQGILGSDHLPYGWSKNRKAFEGCAEFAYEQKLLPEKLPIEAYFEPFAMALE
jgi:4,5-dihydroxyphthalate decarboxylase